MISLRTLFGQPAEVERAHALYADTLRAARQPAIFVAWGVPDTPEGRFEALALTAFLLLRRLKEIDSAAKLAQAYFDMMFDDIDSNLRELGVGDISVGKKVKKLAESFYGRIKAYEDGLAAADDERLRSTLARTLFRDAAATDTALDAAVAYVRGQAAYLAAQNDDALLDGRVTFSSVETLIGEGVR